MVSVWEPLPEQPVRITRTWNPRSHKKSANASRWRWQLGSLRPSNRTRPSRVSRRNSAHNCRARRGRIDTCLPCRRFQSHGPHMAPVTVPGRPGRSDKQFKQIAIFLSLFSGPRGCPIWTPSQEVHVIILARQFIAVKSAEKIIERVDKWDR